MSKTKEIFLIQRYVEETLKGKEAAHPAVKTKEARQLLVHVEKVLEFQKTAVAEARQIMQISSQISSFDVEMSFMSGCLADFAGKLSDLSQSNLAIVEETTATMGQVRENVSLTSNKLSQLSDESRELTEKNSESQKLLQEVEQLKEDVVHDTLQMREQITKLVELVQEIEGIVNSVQGIATQTNLLALNASIEAARAGEQGKGFAVVAGEVGKLAENTQKELNAMKEFVARIYEASQSGQKSTEQAAESTQEMSGKIDTVFSTVGENISMLGQVAEDVTAIEEFMKQADLAMENVNDAMEQCSQDAEEITGLTEKVRELADEGRAVANKMEQIDSQLTSSTNLLYKGMNSGITMLTNEQLIQVLESARQAHMDWGQKVVFMTESQKIVPLQLNPNKCAFGHFYNAITVRHSKLIANWEMLNEVHSKYHSLGGNVIEAIEEGDAPEAEKRCREAVDLSQEVINILDEMIQTIETMTEQGESVF